MGRFGKSKRATIVAIYENGEWAANMHWEFRPGFEVPVLVDPDDRDVVLITQRLS